MIQTTKNNITYFIADLHLAEDRPDITACFLLFLKDKAQQADALYILGDLFEYWIGDDNNTPLALSVSQALKTLSDSGTKLYFIQGNRDFLLGKKYSFQAGMTLLSDVEKITLYEQDFIIMHGDTLCTKDVAYQKFRLKSRSWWWQFIIKSLPLCVRRKIAKNYRKKSANETAMKSQDIMDVTQNEVENTLRTHACETLIHGHTHRPNVHTFTLGNKTAKRIVLGDWYEQGSYLEVSKEGACLKNMHLV